MADDAVRALIDSERRYRILAENASDVVYTVDRGGVVTWVSPSVYERLGWRPDQVVGRPIRDLMHPGDLAALIEERRMLEQSGVGGGSSELRFATADAQWSWMSLSGRALYDDDGTLIAGVESLRDINDRKQTEQSLEHAARHDSLTGLANRAYLIEEITRALHASRRSGTHTAVLMIDLDNFKVVNDSLGHACGDELLCGAAARLSALVRDSDLVARQGGDEFAVVMRDVTDLTDVMRTAQRVVEAFRAPIVVGDYELVTTASIGVVVSRDEVDAGALLMAADRSLYVAKDSGRDRASLFDDSIERLISRRLSEEEDLRSAVRLGELAVWFQPGFVLDGDSARISAVEALVRWRRHDGSVSDAAEFIDIAEETGLITDIGEWVIRIACRHAARWTIEYGLDMVVAINISTRQLLDPGLVDLVDRAIAESGVDPSRIVLEFPESPTLRAHSLITDNLDQLAARGIPLVVDGFGAEYASLIDLRDLPVGAVKLHPSLVRSSITHPTSRELTAGLVSLSQRLGLLVIAGGVETMAEAAVMHEFGCDRQQGFLFARAMPAADVEQLLASGGRVSLPLRG
jgi:diguanylate cyclase (GGDEF)-like protein/PAS domain S-box-containing protein